MNTFIRNIFLAIFWAAMTETFTPVNLVAGFFLGYAILWFSQPLIGESAYFRKVFQAIAFFLHFLWSVTSAAARVTWALCRPLSALHPGVVAVPLDLETDGQILLLSMIITLTPGSVSLDVSHDRRVLYLHAINVKNPDAIRESIKTGFERRVKELMQ